MNAVKLLPMPDESLEEMKGSSHDDEILQQLKTVIQTGWPEDKHLLPVVLAPYFSYWDELNVYQRWTPYHPATDATENKRTPTQLPYWH